MYGLILLINAFQSSNVLDKCRDICLQVRKIQPILDIISKGTSKCSMNM